MRSESAPAAAMAMPVTNPRSWLRTLVIALTAFLTLVDLFAMQAILPALIRHYGTSPGAMGVAVNASTVGMALSSLATSCLSASIDRRRGITVSLVLLAIPTALLAGAPDLATFTGLRVLQGVFMAAAFTLMLAHLGEHYSASDGAAAFAAYIAGNVASNFFGRLLSASVTDQFGLATTFFVFAGLNLAGAVLVHVTVRHTPAMAPFRMSPDPGPGAWRLHLAAPELRASFAIGFLILFAFIGLFTYVNLVLAAPPLALGMMEIGFVYFVFAPSVVTTLLAGGLARRLGTRRGLLASLGAALAGLPLLVLPSLAAVLGGLVLFAIGTFAAQAIATGHVGRTAQAERGAASGLYLASYFFGGLVGSVALGQIFQRFGWSATVLAIGLALLVAACLAASLGRQAGQPGQE